MVVDCSQFTVISSQFIVHSSQFIVFVPRSTFHVLLSYVKAIIYI
jgi:hypothetical protein